MTDHEYGALVRQWNLWGEKNKVNVIQQKIPVPVTSKKEFVGNFFRGVTKKTKVIFISQITSPTAIIFPIKEIINMAKEKGILTIVDGAHVPGHIDININELEILRQEDTNMITVSLTYSVINTNINDTLQIDFT